MALDYTSVNALLYKNYFWWGLDLIADGLVLIYVAGTWYLLAMMITGKKLFMQNIARAALLLELVVSWMVWSHHLLADQLTSLMHMAWVKYTCGRLKSDYRYSKDLVYNNYPFPQKVSDKNKQTVEQKAKAVLDTRALYVDSSLADLYDPLSMPSKLKKAHKELDIAVDRCYTNKVFKNDKERIVFLFELYEKYLDEVNR